MGRWTRAPDERSASADESVPDGLALARSRAGWARRYRGC